jgi:outer membrane protein assembly factor BamB
VTALLCAATLSLSAAVFAADWPHWRGPNHDGVSRETGLHFGWKGRPKRLWERRIGSAFSGITGVGKRVFTCGTEGGRQVLFCLDADEGGIAWQADIEGELREGQGGDGTRATPAVDGGKVYIFGARGALLALEAETGKESWRRTFDHRPEWSYSGSVLIEGDLAVISPGKSDGGLLALDKTSGKEVWKADDGGAGYATPYPFTFKDTRYIAGFLASEIIVVEAKTGREAWSTPWKTSYDVNAATPIFYKGYLFVSSGYGTGCALFQLGEQKGQLAGVEVWRNKNLRAKFQTPILWEERLYGADEQAFKCLDLKSGKLLWTQPRIESWGTQNGTVTVADGHLIFLSEGGILQVGRVSPKGFAPLAGAKVLAGRCWTVPTVHEGRLYVRDLENVVCLDLRKG